MDNVTQWEGALIGTDTEQVALRVTSDEKKRLEQLRRAHGLTSKAQVIRVALDLLERAAVIGAAAGLGERGENWRQGVADVHRGAENIRARHGVPSAAIAAPLDSNAADADQEEPANG